MLTIVNDTVDTAVSTQDSNESKCLFFYSCIFFYISRSLFSQAAILNQNVEFPRSRYLNRNVKLVTEFIGKLLQKRAVDRLGSRMYEEIFEDPFVREVSIEKLMKGTIFEVPEFEVALHGAEMKTAPVVPCVSDDLSEPKPVKEGRSSNAKPCLNVADIKGERIDA